VQAVQYDMIRKKHLTWTQKQSISVI